MACCASLWYCTPDGPVEVTPDVDGVYTPPAEWDGSEPHLTEAAAEAACPTPTLPPVDTACCDGVQQTLYLTLSAGGTVTFTYDGSRYWTGSQSLAGCDVYFRWDKDDCSMEYSRDGSTWVVASCFAGEDGCFTCTPTFTTTNYTFSSATLGGACSFGVITGVLSA